MTTRNLLRSRRLWVGIVLLGLVVCGGAIRVEIVSALQHDACQQIAIAVAEKIENGHAVSQDLLDETVATLIGASVINGEVDSDGNPKDLNGNAFEIKIAEGVVTTSTKRSALHPFSSCATWEVDE